MTSLQSRYDVGAVKHTLELINIRSLDTSFTIETQTLQIGAVTHLIWHCAALQQQAHYVPVAALRCAVQHARPRGIGCSGAGVVLRGQRKVKDKGALASAALCCRKWAVTPHRAGPDAWPWHSCALVLARSTSAKRTRRLQSPRSYASAPLRPSPQAAAGTRGGGPWQPPPAGGCAPAGPP